MVSQGAKMVSQKRKVEAPDPQTPHNEGMLFLGSNSLGVSLGSINPGIAPTAATMCASVILRMVLA